MQVPAKVGEVAQEAKNVARKAHPWLKILVKGGYIAKGLIFGMIGILALLAAMGVGGKATNQKGALQTIAQKPFGSVLLVAMAIGLFGYSAWRLLMAVFNPEEQKPFKRVAYAFTGLAYAAIGFAALAAAGGDRSNNTKQLAEWVTQPVGMVAAAIFGAVMMAVGAGQLVNCFKASFMKVLEEDRMSERGRKVTALVGRFGIGARAVIFVVLGWLLIHAAFDHDPHEAGGLEKALKAISLAPAGPWLLGLAALGLLAYMVLMFIEAKYRRITPA